MFSGTAGLEKLEFLKLIETFFLKLFVCVVLFSGGGKAEQTYRGNVLMNATTASLLFY